jgi:hypothetical protein
LHGRGDAFLDTEIKISFMVYIEGEQDSYIVEKILDNKHRASTGWEEKTWNKNQDFTISDIYIPKNKKIDFTSRVDAELYAVSGGFVGRATGELTLNGALKKVTIAPSGYTDASDPHVEITRPENAYYKDNEKIFNFPYPLIFGSIDVNVDASDLESGIERVEFYINDDLKSTDYNVPYSWYLNEKAATMCYLKAVAYNHAGNSEFMRIRIIYINS